MGNSPVIDKTVFFTIKIEGVDYTSYGYTSNNRLGSLWRTNISHTKCRITGLPMSKIILTASKVYQPGGSSNTNTIQLGNCDLHIALQKDNVDIIGEYTTFIGRL